MTRSFLIMFISLYASVVSAQEVAQPVAEVAIEEPVSATDADTQAVPPFSTVPKDDFVPSFGEAPITLLYTPDAINPYFDNIAKYERDGFEVESLSEDEKA